MKNTIKTAMALALITTTYAMEDDVDLGVFQPTVEVKKSETAPKPIGGMGAPTINPIGGMGVPTMGGGMKIGGLGKPSFKITPIAPKPVGVLFDPTAHIARAEIDSAHPQYRPATDVVDPSSYVLKTQIDESVDGSRAGIYVLRTAKKISDDAVATLQKELKTLKTTQRVQNKVSEIMRHHNAESLAHVAQLLGIGMDETVAESELNYHTPTTADNYEARIDALKVTGGTGVWADDVAEGHKSLLSGLAITAVGFENRAKAMLHLEHLGSLYGLILDGSEDGDAMIAKFDTWAAANPTANGVSDGAAKAELIGVLDRNNIAHS